MAKEKSAEALEAYLRAQGAVPAPGWEEPEVPGKDYDIAVLTSRWDYGSDGSRVGLLLQLKERAEAEGGDFLVVLGGVVSKQECFNKARKIHEADRKVRNRIRLELDRLKDELKSLRLKLKKLEGKNDRITENLRKEISKKLSEIEDKNEELKTYKPRTIAQILAAMAEELAQQINKDLDLLPLYLPDGKTRMKIYIVTSQAYDGDIGRDVVQRLVELRKDENDIRYLSSRYPENTTFKVPLKNSEKRFAITVPTKAVWRAKYYSTLADGLLEEERERTARELCDLYAVGCGASSLNRGHGEIPWQRITVPALHRLATSATVQNMVGIRIVKFTRFKENCAVKTFSMKDFTSWENQFVIPPKGATKLQLAIIEAFKKASEWSIGLLEDELHIPREKLEKALPGLIQGKSKIIEYDEGSSKYFLSQEWLKQSVRYNWPTNLKKEVLAIWACSHFGSVHTAYKYFVNELPERLFKEEATHFLAIGDVTQGLEHDLMILGEIIGSMNNTTQEVVAGVMIATVALKVLSMRLSKYLENLSAEEVAKISPETVEKLIMEFLLFIWYWIGNHDDWAKRKGHTPLHVMESTLREQLGRGIEAILKKFNLPFISLEKILDEKISRVKNGKNKASYKTLPSGVTVAGKHIYAGRTQTSSTWCQRALDKFKEAQIVCIANFHTEEIVEKWEAKLGLRVCIQVPTLMVMSEYEDNKTKTTDFGVGLLKVWSSDGRIVASETNFIGENPDESFDNNELYRLFLSSLGVGEWVDLKKAIR